eukprot:gene12126-biopygen6427
MPAKKASVGQVLLMVRVGRVALTAPAGFALLCFGSPWRRSWGKRQWTRTARGPGADRTMGFKGTDAGSRFSQHLPPSGAKPRVGAAAAAAASVQQGIAHGSRRALATFPLRAWVRAQQNR